MFLTGTNTRPWDVRQISLVKRLNWWWMKIHLWKLYTSFNSLLKTYLKYHFRQTLHPVFNEISVCKKLKTDPILIKVCFNFGVFFQWNFHYLREKSKTGLENFLNLFGPYLILLKISVNLSENDMGQMKE